MKPFSLKIKNIALSLLIALGSTSMPLFVKAAANPVTDNRLSGVAHNIDTAVKTMAAFIYEFQDANIRYNNRLTKFKTVITLLEQQILPNIRNLLAQPLLDPNMRRAIQDLQDIASEIVQIFKRVNSVFEKHKNERNGVNFATDLEPVLDQAQKKAIAGGLEQKLLQTEKCIIESGYTATQQQIAAIKQSLDLLKKYITQLSQKFPNKVKLLAHLRLILRNK